MSLRAMVWALEDAPVDDQGALLVLIALAERADGDGLASWPGKDWLAMRARCSTRSVQRKLSDLRDLGLIVAGDQALVDHIRPDHRPVVYDLDLSKRRGDSLTPRANGETAGVSRGDRAGSHGETLLAHKPSSIPNGIETTLEPSTHEPPALVLLQQSQEGDPFTTFWAAYPRKIAKPAARKAYATARKRGVPTIVIQAALDAFQFSPEVNYRPYPATWLNQAHWENDGTTQGPVQKSSIAPPAEWHEGDTWSSTQVPRAQFSRTIPR